MVRLNLERLIEKAMIAQNYSHNWDKEGKGHHEETCTICQVQKIADQAIKNEIYY